MPEQQRKSSGSLRRVLENPLNERRAPLSSRLLQWGVAAIVSVGVFAWLANWSALRSPDESRPPPEPRLFEMVPADYMTPSEGLVRPPSLRAADGDAALLAGDAAGARALYAEACQDDGRDRYSAFLSACTALELGGFDAAEAALKVAAAPEPPLRSPLRSLRIAARMVGRHARRPDEPIADLWLRALAAEALDPQPAGADGHDGLRELWKTRLLSERVAPSDPERVALDRRPLLELVVGTATLDSARSLADSGATEIELLALTRLRALDFDGERGAILAALQRLAATEPDNAYHALLLASLLAPEALATSRPFGSDVPTLATEDEPDLLAGLSSESIAALEEASRRTRCDPHLREMLQLEATLRGEAGDRFAPLHVRAPRELLFLGDPDLPGRITYRALIAERNHGDHEVTALLQGAVALAGFASELAHDPRAIEDPWSHRVTATSLVDRCRALGLDDAPLADRIAGFEPLVRADGRLAPIRGEIELPLPIPRLVHELFERYAADRAALYVTLRRYLDEP